MLLSFCWLLILDSHAQKRSLKPDPRLLTIVDSSLHQSARQYRFLAEQLATERFPVSFYANEKRLTTTGSEPWVSGFYPGTLLYLYEATKDSFLYKEALRKLQPLEKEQFNKTTHDLGFMMYCSFGNANRLSPDEHYQKVIVNSAISLSNRFNKNVGCIRSWDSGPSQFMVIIDNMMNLELLFAATRLTGDSSFYNIAITHANTTIKNHLRPDHSSYHLVIYDPQNGSIQKRQTVQGAADESAWGRGQAWGFYGFTMMYRETHEKKYLEQARGMAQYILNHLPADKIPYWDYNAPGIPTTYRDASAAAITCSALIELAQIVKGKEGKKYLKVAEAMLYKLSSPEYRATSGDNGGFILKHGVGNFPRHSEVDVPLIYADYYYAEALVRYKKLGAK